MINFLIGLFIGAVIGFFVAALFCGRKREDERYEAAMKRWENGMDMAEQLLVQPGHDADKEQP